MINKIGRILARKNTTAGLFIPMGKGLPNGVWEIREIMGEYVLKKVGLPDMKDKQYQALDLEGLHNNIPNSCMTRKELKECGL